jgi:biotin-[acetyl-CoA-carboxylase] ligase BirA-like protein
LPAGIRPDKLQEGLRTGRFGKSIFFSHEVGSTNDWAKELAKLGAEEGTVAVAEVQTAGRGRLGREWISPKGGLWFSVVLRPAQLPSETARLVFVAGLAVVEVLRKTYDLKAEIKWPNDVLVNGRKVCGILCEMNTAAKNVRFVVVGVGVNVNFDVEKVFPGSLKSTTTSLKDELGQTVHVEELFKALLESLEKAYDLCNEDGFAAVLDKWRQYAGFLGKKVKIADEKETISGLAQDVDDEGALVLRLGDGMIKRILVGDVSMRTG